ncbi:MAG: membrane protein insertase YidC [Gemmatimonadales bacterium]
MNQRRVILAISLMLIVAVLPGILFTPSADRRIATSADTGAVGEPPTSPAPPPATATPPSTQPVGSSTAALAAETVWVTSPLYRLGFTTRGAQLVSAELTHYRSFGSADAGQRVQLVPEGHQWLGERLLVGTDTLPLANLAFAADRRALTVLGGDTTLTFTAPVGAGRVTRTFRFSATDYRFSVEGHVEGLGGTGAVLVVDLGQGLRSVEADPQGDALEYAVVTKADKTRKTTFASLDSGEAAVLEGPFEWVAVKSKYFFVAVLAQAQNERPFAGAVMIGRERVPARVGGLFGASTAELAMRAAVATALTLPGAGTFRFDVYVGPFEHQRLVRLGHGLDDANPYGWSIFRPIIHPVSLVVVQVLFWMHDRLHLAYGWVLVIFGVIVRLLLWPLQARAMESQMRMQAVQPLMQELQTRYKKEPEKLQREMLKLYKEHKVNPLGGCLPMLLPMPVLLALFFVFSNTIEFRGVPFLWLPDLSRHDPYYVIPILMGLSMFAVSKLGQRGLPPNPQMKMLLYVMPAVLTFVFLRLASGLNLYYAVQNLISLPQQWQISQRRLGSPARPPGKS